MGRSAARHPNYKGLGDPTHWSSSLFSFQAGKGRTRSEEELQIRDIPPKNPPVVDQSRTLALVSVRYRIKLVISKGEGVILSHMYFVLEVLESSILPSP